MITKAFLCMDIFSYQLKGSSISLEHDFYLELRTSIERVFSQPQQSMQFSNTTKTHFLNKKLDMYDLQRNGYVTYVYLALKEPDSGKRESQPSRS